MVKQMLERPTLENMTMSDAEEIRKYLDKYHEKLTLIQRRSVVFQAYFPQYRLLTDEEQMQRKNEYDARRAEKR